GGDTVQETGPRFCVRRLERIVVTLDSGPDDHLRADIAGKGESFLGQAQRLSAGRVVGRAKTTLTEPGVEMETARDAVDAVSVECVPDSFEVLAGELLRVVELVVVDQVAKSFDGCAHLLDGRRARELGLVSARIEPRRHASERPDPETRLHAPTLSLQPFVVGNGAICVFSAAKRGVTIRA